MKYSTVLARLQNLIGFTLINKYYGVKTSKVIERHRKTTVEAFNLFMSKVMKTSLDFIKIVTKLNHLYILGCMKNIFK